MASQFIMRWKDRRRKFLRLRGQDPRAATKAAWSHILGCTVMALAGRVLNSLRGVFYLQYRPDSHYVFRQMPEFKKLFRAWTKGNMGANGGDTVRLYSLFLNAREVLKKTPSGDIAELGVYKGNSAKVFAFLAEKYDRKLFLFDTFEGFSAEDLSGVDRDNVSPFGDTSLEKVRKFVDCGRAVYVKGHFPQSLAEGPDIGALAIVHIDCDLYAPAKAGLEYFFPKLVPGGLLIVHDYSSGFWPGLTSAVDEYFRGRPETPVLLPDKAGTVIFRKATGPS